MRKQIVIVSAVVVLASVFSAYGKKKDVIPAVAQITKLYIHGGTTAIEISTIVLKDKAEGLKTQADPKLAKHKDSRWIRGYFGTPCFELVSKPEEADATLEVGEAVVMQTGSHATALSAIDPSYRKADVSETVGVSLVGKGGTILWRDASFPRGDVIELYQTAGCSNQGFRPEK